MFRNKTMDTSRIVPTSKLSLKLSCLDACRNDIAEARKLYDYIASDLPGLPDTEPDRPGILSQADEVFGWIGKHKDDIMQGVSFVQGLRGGGAPTASQAPAGVAAPINPNV